MNHNVCTPGLILLYYLGVFSLLLVSCEENHVLPYQSHGKNINNTPTHRGSSNNTAGVSYNSTIIEDSAKDMRQFSHEIHIKLSSVYECNNRCQRSNILYQIIRKMRSKRQKKEKSEQEDISSALRQKLKDKTIFI